MVILIEPIHNENTPTIQHVWFWLNEPYANTCVYDIVLKKALLLRMVGMLIVKEASKWNNNCLSQIISDAILK
jgi:hypothetical protein